MNEAALSDKVASLERTVRTLRMVAVALVASQILWFLMGATQQEDQKVRRFAIVDKDGKPRIEMKTDEVGNPSVALLDAKGAVRAYLTSDDFGSDFKLMEKRRESCIDLHVGQGRVATFSLEAGGPHIRMLAEAEDQDRKSELEVGDSAIKSSARIAALQGGTHFTLIKGEYVPVALHADEDGTNGLTISDEKEVERIRLLLDPKEESKFQILDKAGKEIKP